jgi:hypothetical protein
MTRESLSAPYTALVFREVFATSRDPLPRKFEELLAQLQKVETETLQSNHLSLSHGDSDDARGLFETCGRVPNHGEIFQGK